MIAKKIKIGQSFQFGDFTLVRVPTNIKNSVKGCRKSVLRGKDGDTFDVCYVISDKLDVVLVKAQA